MSINTKSSNSSVVWMSVSVILLVVIIMLLFFHFKGEKTVATVNGTEIKQDQLNHALINFNGQEVLDKLIMEELVLQEANKASIKVTPEEVDKQWEKMKSEFSSEKAFQASMAQDGYSEDSLRHEVKIQLYLRKLLEPETRVNEQDVIAYYTEHKAHFIDPEMVKVKHVVAETKEQAESIRKKIQQSADFSETMDKLIDGGNVKGGELDYFSSSAESNHTHANDGEHIDQPFEEAAFLLEEGQLSKVVESSQGFHVILMLDRKLPTAQPFSEVKDDIKEEIVTDKILKRTKTWFDDLRAKADVQSFLITK